MWISEKSGKEDMKTNGPFPSCHKPLFQSGARCEAIDMEMINDSF